VAEYNLGTAKGVIEIEYKGDGARQARQDLNETEGAARKTGPSLDDAANKAGIAGLAIAAGFGMAAKSAADFEQRMSAVGAVSGASESQMDALRQKALQLGAETSFSAGESASAIEELVKAGLSVEDVLNGAADATVNLAAAGEVSMPEAAAIASNAMNQFGLGAKDMVGVVDNIAGAANASAIDVSEFGQSLSQVGAVANLAGVDFKDTATAIALMGNAGIKGSDAGTSLKTMFQRLQPTTSATFDEMSRLGIISMDANKAMEVLAQNGITGVTKTNAEQKLNQLAASLSDSEVGSAKAQAMFQKLGLETGFLSNKFYDAQGNTKGLAEVSDILQESLKGMDARQKQAALTTLFGADAIRGAAVLAGEGAEGFNKMAASMNKVSAAEVAAKRLDNFKGSVEAMMGSLETLGITIGTMILPPLRTFVDWLTQAMNAFMGLGPGAQQAVVAFIGLSGALLLGFAGFVKVMNAVRATQGALLAFRTILVGTTAAQNMSTAAALRQAIAQKAAAVATKLQAAAMAIIRGATIAWTAVQWALNAALLANPIGLIIAAIIALVAAIVLAWRNSETFRAIVIGAWNAIKSASIAVWNAIKGALIAAWNGIKAAVRAGISFVRGIITAGMNAIRAVWQAVWGVFGPLVRAVWGLIVAIIRLQWTIIKGVVLAGVNAVKTVVTGAWNFIKSATSRVWNAIKSVLSSVWNAIKSVVTPAVNAVKSVVTNVWNAIKSATSSVWNAIKSAISGPLNAAQGIVSSVANSIKSVLTSAWNAIKSGVTTAWNGIKSAVDTGINNVVSAVQGLKDRVLGFFSGAGQWLYDAGSQIISGLIDGITSMIGSLTDKISQATDMVGRFLPGSPVREGPLKVLNRGHAGKQIIEMVVGGIEDMRRPLERAMGSVMAVPAVTTDLDRVARAGTTNVAAARLPSPGRGARSGGTGTQRHLRLVEGRLAIDRSGRAWIRGMAEDVYEDNDRFEAVHERMG